MSTHIILAPYQETGKCQQKVMLRVCIECCTASKLAVDWSCWLIAENIDARYSTHCNVGRDLYNYNNYFTSSNGNVTGESIAPSWPGFRKFTLLQTNFGGRSTSGWLPRTRLQTTTTPASCGSRRLAHGLLTERNSSGGRVHWILLSGFTEFVCFHVTCSFCNCS